MTTDAQLQKPGPSRQEIKRPSNYPSAAECCRASATSRRYRRLPVSAQVVDLYSVFVSSTRTFRSRLQVRPKSYWSAPLYGEPTVQARRHRRRRFAFLAPFQLARMLPPMDISDNEEQSWKSNTRRQTRRNFLNSSGLLTFHPPATNCSGGRQTKPKSGTSLLDVAEKIGKMQRIRLQALARSGSRQRMLVVMAEDVPVCWLFWASSSARKMVLYS